VEEGNTQFSSLIGKTVNEENAQKDNETSPPKEAMDIEKAVETHEGIPQTAKENSIDEDQRVEENTEKEAQNVDEETQEVAELLASNMSREEPAQDEPVEFSTGFDLNIEDFNSDFNNEVFQDSQEITQHAQETVEPEVQKVEVSPAEPGVQNVQVTETIQTNEVVEVVENAPNAQEAQTVNQNAQGAEQNQLFADQNIDQNASNEHVMSVDPVSLASRSLPSEEV